MKVNQGLTEKMAQKVQKGKLEPQVLRDSLVFLVRREILVFKDHLVLLVNRV